MEISYRDDSHQGPPNNHQNLTLLKSESLSVKSKLTPLLSIDQIQNDLCLFSLGVSGGQPSVEIAAPTK
jgi:hypothetical protein